MLPPFQASQLLQSTLAIMLPLLTPEPPNLVTFAALPLCGSSCPVPSRGDMVTFWPFAEVYMMKNCPPDILRPYPSATCLALKMLLNKQAKSP